MARRPAKTITKVPPEAHVEQPGPTEFSDPLTRRELKRAIVWFGTALAIIGVIVLAQPLLLIIGGAIFAVFLDGGARLLGRWLPIGRGWRLTIVILLGFGFVGWVAWFAGTTIAAQFETLRLVVTAQLDRLMAFVADLGLIPNGQPANLGSELLGSMGKVTAAVGTASDSTGLPTTSVSPSAGCCSAGWSAWCSKASSPGSCSLMSASCSASIRCLWQRCSG